MAVKLWPVLSGVGEIIAGCRWWWQNYGWSRVVAAKLWLVVSGHGWSRMVTQFSNARNLDIIDGDVDLLFLEKRLEKYLKIFFDPIANIIAIQRMKTDNQHQEKDKETK